LRSFFDVLSSEISPIGELGVIGYIAITSFVACATCAAAVLPSIVTIRRFAGPELACGELVEPVEWACPAKSCAVLSVVEVSSVEGAKQSLSFLRKQESSFVILSDLW
jgi:hypothetical protein